MDNWGIDSVCTNRLRYGVGDGDERSVLIFIFIIIAKP